VSEQQEQATISADEATARLATLTADDAWRDRFLESGAAEVKEFHELNKIIVKGDPVEAAMAGILDNPDIPSSQSKVLAGTVDMLRAVGIADPIVRDFIEGQGVTAAEMKLVEGWKQRQMADSSFVERYLSGDAEARRLMTIANSVIATGIKKEKQS
jgi:hypothetical protein